MILKGKRGQSGSAAAALVILIAVFIILYLIVLPPAERAKLLGADEGVKPIETKEEISVVNKTLLEESPGRIEYLKQDEFDHQLANVNLYTTTSAKILKQQESLYIKNGLFDFLSHEVEFAVPDIEYTENVLLSANIKKAQGRLTIHLNKKLLYDGYAEAFNPIELPKEDLLTNNALLFEVSPVGWTFWTTNEYELRNIKITADVTDVAEQTAKNTFIIGDTEKFNLNKAILRFFPDCEEGKVGRLKVYVNNENVYSAVPECNILNKIELSPEILTAGGNNIVFKTEKGAYYIYQINVHTEMKKQAYPAYYFEMDERLFVGYEEEMKGLCGEMDGICPAGCDEDLDRDCCFEVENKYWCDIVPDDEGDRCVSILSSSQCGKCVTGYENEDNTAPEICEGRCGDDYDSECPAVCSRYYDRDCCFEEDTSNFWCHDVPVYGISNTCKASLSQAQCRDCPSAYETKTGIFGCEEEGLLFAKLSSDYDAYIVLWFVDDKERKSGNVYVNGHKFSFNTQKISYEKKISGFVEAGINSVKIEPDISSIEIRKLMIELRD